MSNEITPHSTDEEIEMLLPFYVTGQLDRGDADKIDEYVSRRPIVARHLSLIPDQPAGAVAPNEAVAARPAGNFPRLATAIAVRPAQTARLEGRLLDRIKRFFEMPASHSRGWISAAAALVIIVQGAAIATLVVTQYSPTFTAASGGREATGAGTFVVVRFADGATTSAVTEVLAGLDMAIVDGPKSGGLFTVRLGARDMKEAERDRAIADLKAHSDLITFVTRLP